MANRITGTAGLGAQTIGLIAAAKAEHIFFTGRNSQRAQEVIEKVQKDTPTAKITYLECNNSNLASIKACADKFLAQATRLDVFIANAGIMAWDPSLSKDGYEIQFAVNHMAHALFLKLFLPLLEKTAAEPNSDVRIVNLTSVAYRTTVASGIEFDTLKTEQASVGRLTAPGKWARYGQSKLANLLYAQSLAKKYPGITSVSLHPGYIRTELFAQTSFMDRLPVVIMARGNWTPVEEGCWNTVWAATTPKSKLENGAYFEPVAKKITPATSFARDDELAEKLWSWTQKELETF
jgi:NAD(P)-dependent dehydrogenase (short-subunit alcohol dehydrogenase family)